MRRRTAFAADCALPGARIHRFHLFRYFRAAVLAFVRRLKTPLPTAPGCELFNDMGSEGGHTGASNNIPEENMNTIIYIVGLVVIIGFILSYFGFR